ncbi:unnamed protein product [Lepeophtheirus salmonis]|uniref:(salmon louse) hypothetical protein n=1 Tax=Lepeophtheirus salmonis TaxID=72036 RepID=A0A7R8CR29_LEPSM|nr:unnamed protein product [Lepeophtheirus salmonis]CAF2900909.1 unnamed protein product [Lepeophtheirus salmonis]
MSGNAGGGDSDPPPNFQDMIHSPSPTTTSQHRAIIINPLETNSISLMDNSDRSVTAAHPNSSELECGDTVSPPPSYHDIPGTVPAHQGVSRGPPPSYEDAVDPNAEPPSYDSLFGRIRDTHKASRNFFDFLIKFIILLMGTIGCTIVCSVTVILPICMIVIGSMYLHQCPAEPYIPLFLVVGGGCIWVYTIYWPNFEPQFEGDTEYCHQAVYVFTYWIITTSYIFLGIFTSCICCSITTSTVCEVFFCFDNRTITPITFLYTCESIFTTQKLHD